jgi:hypothetical protein
MAVDVNLVAFSSGDGKEVRIKGLFRRVGGDIVEGLIVSVKVGGINVDATISRSPVSTTPLKDYLFLCLHSTDLDKLGL